jgi:hypothetical protein
VAEEVERFELEDDDGDIYMIACEEGGDWVRYSDYEKLEAAQREPQAGVMHPIDQSFYDLAVKERDAERRRVDRLEAQRDQARDECSNLKHEASQLEATPPNHVVQIIRDQARQEVLEEVREGEKSLQARLMSDEALAKLRSHIAPFYEPDSAHYKRAMQAAINEVRRQRVEEEAARLERLSVGEGTEADLLLATLDPSGEAKEGFEHCHRCGRGNTLWHAPSPLWNAVMRGGSIDGEPKHDDLVCATCFMQLAEEAGVASHFKVFAERVNVELETTTPSGRVWDEERQLWVDPSGEQGEPWPPITLWRFSWSPPGTLYTSRVADRSDIESCRYVPATDPSKEER